MAFEKKRILFVGDHPYCYSGNGNMMRALLETVDYYSYEAVCFGLYPSNMDQYVNNLKVMASANLSYSLISTEAVDGNPYRGDRLVAVLSAFNFDAVVFVGLDVWCYVNEFKRLGEIRSQTGIKYIGLFPYDSHRCRPDWIEWLSFFDLPCVYSEFGYNMVKDKLTKARYFRPPLADAAMYKPLEPEQREKTRKMLLNNTVDTDVFLFGFFGRNQFRKDIPKVLRALSIVREQTPQAILFANTNIQGVFNIGSLVEDYGLRKGDVLVNDKPISEADMINLYGSMDCLVNCSLQEGLSWTLLNAMLMGTPVIATDTTAQTELVEGAGLLVPCNTIGYLPTFTKYGPANIETKACTAEDLADRMGWVIKDEYLRQDMSEKGRNKALGWLSKVDDLNSVLEEMMVREVQNSPQITGKKIKAVLFAQHSSAGDVLMSTQCFEGLRKRHCKPLVYMTQHQYMDIVTGNEFLDEIIPWEPSKLKEYEIVYNPHGERILPGGFNNLDVTLYSMYPYFCKVQPGEIKVDLQPAFGEFSTDFLSRANENVRPICIVHTTGGQAQYRTYKHLDLALSKLGLFIIQVGSIDDWPVRCAGLDLRGKLTWRETAWVMKQADIAVCVDSFPMHLAGALGIDTVAIFGPAPARVTQPRMQHGAKLICLEPNKLDVCPSLTNCWGQPGQNVCKTPCINTVPPHKVKAAVKELLGGDA